MAVPDIIELPEHWRGDSYGPMKFTVTSDTDLTGVTAKLTFRKDYDEGEIVQQLTSDNSDAGPAPAPEFAIVIDDAEKTITVRLFKPAVSGDLYWDLELTWPADDNGHERTQTPYAGVWEVTQDRTPN